MAKLLSRISNKKGMTLIEVIVAFAMVAVISVVIIIGFRTMGSVLKEGGDTSRIDQQLEKEIATSSPGAVEPTPAAIELSGSSIKIDGNIQEYYVEGEDGSKQSFRIFVAD